MFANPILTESAGVNRHLFFSTFNYEWDRLWTGFLGTLIGYCPNYSVELNVWVGHNYTTIPLA